MSGVTVPARLAKAGVRRVSDNLRDGQEIAVPGGVIFALFKTELMARYVRGADVESSGDKESNDGVC